MTKFLLATLFMSFFLISAQTQAETIQGKTDGKGVKKIAKDKSVKIKKNVNKPKKVTINFEHKKKNPSKKKIKYWSMHCAKGYISGEKAFCAIESKRLAKINPKKIKQSRAVASRAVSETKKR